MMWSRSQHSTQDTQRSAPFVLERRFEDVRQGGYFTPTAAVWITPALRESGLLRDLAPEDLRLLLAVLSSVNGNGAFIATPELLAPALGLSIGATRSRLERLKSVLWDGVPLLTSCSSKNNLHFFQPSPHLLKERQSVISPAPARGEHVELPEIAPPNEAPTSSGYVSISARDEVIAHSRATYTRPRAEVEAEINRFLSPDWQKADSGSQGKEAEEEAALPDTPGTREWLRLKRALVALGVPLYRAEALLASHAADKIARQLEWLPYRQARSPAAYVVAAIEKDYAPPPSVSLRQAAEQQAVVSSDPSTPNQGQEHLGEESNGAEIEIHGMDELTDRKEADEAP